MNIDKDTVVTLRYKVADAQGKLIEEAKEPMAYLHGGYGNTLPKIEEALAGQTAGYQTTLLLNPKTVLACVTRVWRKPCRVATFHRV